MVDKESLERLSLIDRLFHSKKNCFCAYLGGEIICDAESFGLSLSLGDNVPFPLRVAESVDNFRLPVEMEAPKL